MPAIGERIRRLGLAFLGDLLALDEAQCFGLFVPLRDRLNHLLVLIGVSQPTLSDGSTFCVPIFLFDLQHPGSSQRIVRQVVMGS